MIKKKEKVDESPLFSPTPTTKAPFIKRHSYLNKRTGPSLGAERAHVTNLGDKSFDFPANEEKQQA